MFNGEQTKHSLLKIAILIQEMFELNVYQLSYFIDLNYITKAHFPTVSKKSERIFKPNIYVIILSADKRPC